MPNGDDEGNQNVAGPYSPDNKELRNRMRFQEALHSELMNNVNWLMQSEQDLLKVFRFYILVLAAFISALSVLVTRTNANLSDLINFYTVIAGVFWAIAVLGAIVAYAVILSALGIDRMHHVRDQLAPNVLLDEEKTEVFDKLNLKERLDGEPHEFEEEIIFNYIQSIHHTEREFGHRYGLLWGGMLLIPISGVVFGVGILTGIVEASTVPIQDGSLLLSKPIHLIGIVGLIGGVVVSVFLVLQMVALGDRMWEKVKGSAITELIPVRWLITVAGRFPKVGLSDVFGGDASKNSSTKEGTAGDDPTDGGDQAEAGETETRSG